MKTQLSKLLIFSLFVIALGSCKKDAEMPNGEFVNLKTSEATEITAVSAMVSAKAGADCTGRGVCWGKAPNPTIDDFHVANGSGKGEYTCTLTGLEPNQKYYYRAYGFDGKRYAYAKDEKEFVTKDGVVKVTTGSATNIGSTYATLGGVVNDDGMPILERGVCYGLEPGTSIDGPCMTSTDSTNTFAVALTGLENETLYYYKAYVKPLLGSIVYGDELTFTTLDGRPVVFTIDIAYITATSAKCSGAVTDEGHASVLERGICWSKNATPTLDDFYIASGNGTGSFETELTNLEVNTTYHVCAYATNALGTRYGNEKTFTTKDGVAKVTTGNVTDITATSATCSGEVSDDGGFAVTERGICWSKNANPTLDDEDAENIASGDGTGSFEIELSDLEPNATYHVCAYATNALGTRYASEKTFNTKDGVAKVTTGNVTDITATSAKCSGNITDDGGFAVTERGFCWSTHPEPTLENNDPHIAAGSGTGEFSATITNLMPDTSYHIRAYATNSMGETYYAQNGKIFTTEDGLPSVATGNVTDITTTSATCSGEVTDDGGFAVTERGICWSTTQNPTLENAQHVAAGSGTGEFSATLTGLTEYTKYYVRAYATNSQGTSYGSETHFTPGLLYFTANGVSFAIIPVEGGTFWMGAQSTNPNGQNYDSEAYDSESPVHQVTLSSYYMGETEVTQALWQAVMGSNPSSFSGSNLPVETVCWNDCQTFITKLNQLCASQLNGRQFRLPTEAEWEYAARGGNKSQGYKYSGSNTLGDVAWYHDNCGSKTHAVGTKQANELGLYDMSGNVEEWCSDWYGDYSSSAQTDPTGPSSGWYRVLRGDCWAGHARSCRVSYREFTTPDDAYFFNGLRLSLR